MSKKRHLVKIIKQKIPEISKNFISAIKKKLVWLLRTLFLNNKRTSSANAGFVLPTVAMVSVVAVLLTTAILYRSYDRAQNASNVRVNQAVLAAASPAIDRGRAKLSKLFEDRRLPRATPTDDALYELLTVNASEYTLGDETQLRLTYTEGAIDQQLDTAWRFPVDTDNNGKFDSFTVYGIYFRTPPVNSNTNQYQRQRTPLEARTPPMIQGNLDPVCGDGTSAILVGNTGWIQQNNELRKSFFIYTATAPITNNPQTDPSIPAAERNNYEQYQGNKSIAALEYQQDRLQIPPNNNAVVYEDDIILSPGPTFNLNGAIFTNSNFLATGQNGGQITMHQVSANSSCYYEARNAKIFVGGNLAMGNTGANSNITATRPRVHLYNGKTAPVITQGFENSATENPGQIAYNNLAYEDRIERLVAAQMANGANSDPSEVRQGIEKRRQDLGLASFTPEELADIREEQLALYFKRRTRRVPYREVAFNGNDPSPSPLLQGTGESLRPNDRWIYPTNPNNGINGGGFTGLTLRVNAQSMEPKASAPDEIRRNGGREAELGDRVIVGNNLPELWWDNNRNRFVGPGFEDTQALSNIRWNQPADTTEGRFRRTTVQTLADVGSTARDGVWELDAARVPADPTEPVGGLRVVTGAGIYLEEIGRPSRFSGMVTTVWPDTNPARQAPLPPGLEGRDPPDPATPGRLTQLGRIRPYWMYAGLINTRERDPSRISYAWREMFDDLSTAGIDEQVETPFLQMRATAVYHYKSAGYNQQNPRPIACVSSFYVPTNATTALNRNGLPGTEAEPNNPDRLSNNGIVYPPPPTLEAAPSVYRDLLEYESRLTYPLEPGQTVRRPIDDGLLARALAKAPANRTLSEQSAIDAQMCAAQIRYNSSFTPVTNNPPIPHGAIREVTFLAPREVKQNSLNGNTVYDLPIKDRQPIETRATVLDLQLLRTTTIGPGPAATQEYLLPNSGLIYATRDDALRDRSDPTSREKSALDYILDPTRRPNAILLVNGERLWRQQDYRDAEKGFILATNLPTYIKGEFNIHRNNNGLQQEFTEALDTANNWNNFYSRSTLNPNFACRRNDPRLPLCTVGDEWRPATVLADVVTLVSGSYREGFRNEGDYDWSDLYNYPDFAAFPRDAGGNTSPILTDQFSRFNNYATHEWLEPIVPQPIVPPTFRRRSWVDPATGRPRGGNDFSSYLSNFVTPVDLRIKRAPYLTEACFPDNAPTGVTPQAYCNDPFNWQIQTRGADACTGSPVGNTTAYIHGSLIDSSNRVLTGFAHQDNEEWREPLREELLAQNLPTPGYVIPASCLSEQTNVLRRIAFLRNASDGSLVLQNGRLQVLAHSGSGTATGPIRIFDFGYETSAVGNAPLQLVDKS
ncbi:hormogonium polysaccharide biosynthesis protein HpsA [Nodularia chucula]|uniref:hormogonium polysaccharide biosynthesis protein HpsA n=1 Tax=Nodularia chucula TaxID=3093667 RepID=UPI0039C73D06